MRTSVASFFESLWTSCSADIASEFQGNDNRNQTHEYPIHMHEGQGILSWGLRTKQLQLQRDSKTHQHAVHHTISLPQLLRERYRLLRPKLHPTLLDPSQLPQFAWRERKPWVKYQCQLQQFNRELMHVCTDLLSWQSQFLDTGLQRSWSLLIFIQEVICGIWWGERKSKKKSKDSVSAMLSFSRHIGLKVGHTLLEFHRQVSFGLGRYFLPSQWLN